MERLPKSGEFYRHFKNKMYQIVAVATHSETGEKLVIYQALYGDYQVYARPLAMFVSEVDHVKYPAVTQRYRFERVEQTELGAEAAEEPVASADKSGMTGGKRSEENVGMTVVSGKEAGQQFAPVQETAIEEEGGVSPRLMAFFDADDMETKYNILISMRDEITDHMINNLAVSLDMVIPEGDIMDRYEELKRCIRTKQRYEKERLR